MDRIINHLLQLQELALIREEHRQTGEGEHLERLNDAIDEMTDKLSPSVKLLYQRLSKKDRLVMAPMYDGSCAVCGMKLPISQVQLVRRGQDLQNCPSCARVLFESGSPRWVGEKPKRYAPRKAGISRFSSENLMVPNMAAGNKQEAIRELAENMQATGFVDNAEKLVGAALDREAILSTNVDCGLAFPHVRGIEGGGLILGLGVSREGIVFDGNEYERSHFIFFSTIPTAASAFYLKLLAGLTEAFIKEQNRELLLAAETPAELWKVLTKATRYTVR